MEYVLARNWWALVLRGVIAIIFGLVAFFWPVFTLETLVLVFGIFALANGVASLIAAFTRHGTDAPGWVLAIEGIAGIAAGILTFAWPAITALVLLYLIAAWAVVTGVMEIVAAIRLRKQIQGEWLMALAGVLSVAFGIICFFSPVAGALAIVWLIGWYAILEGIVLISLGVRLRSHAHRFVIPTTPPAPAAPTGGAVPA